MGNPVARAGAKLVLWEDLPTSSVPPVSVPVPEATLQMGAGTGLTEVTISPLSQTQQRPQTTCPVVGSTALGTLSVR